MFVMIEYCLAIALFKEQAKILTCVQEVKQAVLEDNAGNAITYELTLL